MTGLSRTVLSELCRRVDTTGRPIITTLRLKQRPNATRATLLIKRASLLSYLDTEAEKQAAETLSVSQFNKAALTVAETELAADAEHWDELVGKAARLAGHDWSPRNLNSRTLRRAAMTVVGLTTKPSEEARKRATALLAVQGPIRQKVELSEELESRLTNFLRTRRPVHPEEDKTSRRPVTRRGHDMAASRSRLSAQRKEAADIVREVRATMCRVIEETAADLNRRGGNFSLDDVKRSVRETALADVNSLQNGKAVYLRHLNVQWLKATSAYFGFGWTETTDQQARKIAKIQWLRSYPPLQVP